MREIARPGAVRNVAPRERSISSLIHTDARWSPIAPDILLDGDEQVRSSTHPRPEHPGRLIYRAIR